VMLGYSIHIHLIGDRIKLTNKW